MQKWEYKIVVAVPGSIADITMFLNEAGADGWELVVSAPEWQFVFKRPLPPPQP